MEKLKISIIVPSLNMVSYIEETILSILNQKYKNLELIVIDGGSTDGTRDILKKYADHFSIFLSEKDGGMYYAINKGINLSSGDIIAWLNADDLYFPWTLRTVEKIFFDNPQIEWLCGIPAFLSEDGSLKNIYNNVSAKPQKAILNGWFKNGGYGFLQQESMFWKRDLYFKAEGLNLNFKLAADFELWIKFAKYSELWSLNLPLAAFRIRNSSLSKKYEDKYINEVANICHYLKSLPFLLYVFGNNTILNMIIRLITVKKTKIVHQPLLSEEFVFEERYRSISSLTITQLLLEYSYKKK